MKTALKPLCRLRLFVAAVGGVGICWAMTASCGLAVGIAVGGGFALVLLQRDRSC